MPVEARSSKGACVFAKIPVAAVYGAQLGLVARNDSILLFLSCRPDAAGGDKPAGGSA